ncbi:MAG: hypothetical protein ACOZAJ_02260, partial [Patescibacteria group bacterium]
MSNKLIILITSILFLIGLIKPIYGAEIIDQEPAIFRAEVISVINEQQQSDESGKIFYEQELKLKALNGNLTGTEFITNSNSQQELSGLKYQAGDQVMVSKTIDNNGLNNFLIT